MDRGKHRYEIWAGSLIFSVVAQSFDIAVRLAANWWATTQHYKDSGSPIPIEAGFDRVEREELISAIEH